MELLHPLMHDCGWAYDDCGPQSSIPAEMKTKQSEILSILEKYHFYGYEDVHKNFLIGKLGAGKINPFK